MSTDLAANVDSAAYGNLLEVWLRLMTAADVTSEMLERLRAAYTRDVAVLRPDEVSAIIASAGFDTPVRFYQAGLVHGWYAKRPAHAADR